MNATAHTATANTPGEDLSVGTTGWATTATASKVPGMLGMSPYESPKSTWLRMRHPDSFPKRESAAMRRGTLLEAGYIALWFANNPRFTPLSDGEVTCTRDDLGFRAAATPDCLALDNETGETVCIEHKTAGRNANHSKWGTPGTDIIPDNYLIQGIWQMICSGHRRVAVIKSGPFIDDQDTFWLNWNEPVAAQVISVVAAFMKSIDDDIEPENDEREETYNALRQVYTGIDRDEGEDWEIGLDYAIEYTAALQAFEAAEGRLFHSKSNLINVMGNARRAVIELAPEIGRNGKPKRTKSLVVASRQQKGTSVSIVKPRTALSLTALHALRTLQSPSA